MRIILYAYVLSHAACPFNSHMRRSLLRPGGRLTVDGKRSQRNPTSRVAIPVYSISAYAHTQVRWLNHKGSSYKLDFFKDKVGIQLLELSRVHHNYRGIKSSNKLLKVR